MAPRQSRHAFSFGLLAPALLVALGVVFYPICHAIYISLHDTLFLNKTDFVGAKHYIQFFSQPQGLQNIKNSVVLVFGSLSLSMPIALGLALLLNQRIPFIATFRVLLVLPWVISQVITAMLWSWIVNPQYGLITVVTDALRLARVDVFGETATAMIGLILVDVWRTFPFAMLLILAALQTVPRDLLEAARMDGAGAWSSFRYVTFPRIRSTLLVATIQLSLSYFNHVDLPLVLTGGGPLGATEILSLRIYNEAFVYNKIGFGSAIAVIVFLTNVVLSLAYIRILRRNS